MYTYLGFFKNISTFSLLCSLPSFRPSFPLLKNELNRQDKKTSTLNNIIIITMRFTLLLALPFLSAMTAMAANVNVDRLDKKWGANDECVSTMPACLLTYLPTYVIFPIPSHATIPIYNCAHYFLSFPFPSSVTTDLTD